MKSILKYAALLAASFALTACDEFFNPETDNVLDHTNYINEESEMYSGYIGIMTKVQAVGDRIIYLTDTRGELLEPTLNTPSDLYAIYNYDTDLTGNTYADPAPYYDVVIACNDYLLKLYEYKRENPAAVNMAHYRGLVSSTLRIKAWTYLTIGKIYGKALWYNDPLRQHADLSKVAEVKDLKEIVKSCIDMLDKGFDEVDAQQTILWKEWLDPYTETASSIYRVWDFMTPEYFALYAELCLWDGQYLRALNLLLSTMNTRFADPTKGDGVSWLRSERKAGRWTANLYTRRDGHPVDYEDVVSAIIYNYAKNQTNSLKKHFKSDYPNQYLLRPSEVGMNRFLDEVFNPKGSTGVDSRTNGTFYKNSADNYEIRKFGSNTSASPAYQDDISIYYYRGADLYFMLLEALNHLGRYTEANAIMNQGVGGTFPNGGVIWPGFTDDWTGVTTFGTRKYADKGIRGVFNLGQRTLTQNAKDNDLAMLDEMMLEFACEGRIYPAMIRVAMRHGDFSIIADRVCPKYENADEIRSKILDGKGYFIQWDLNGK